MVYHRRKRRIVSKLIGCDPVGASTASILATASFTKHTEGEICAKY
jgi:hypothetical protein